MYEAHITTASGNVSAPVANGFRDTCLRLGVKPLWLELLRGQHSFQLMSSSRYETKHPIEASVQAGELLAKLHAKGYPVKRIKIEAPLFPGYGGVTVAYYEAHWKFKPGPRFTSLEVPRNSRVRESFNKWTGAWYLTARYPGTSPRYCAKEKFDNITAFLKTFIKANRFDGQHYEAVLLDTNPDLDKGWF